MRESQTIKKKNDANYFYYEGNCVTTDLYRVRVDINLVFIKSSFATVIFLHFRIVPTVFGYRILSKNLCRRGKKMNFSLKLCEIFLVIFANVLYVEQFSRWIECSAVLQFAPTIVGRPTTVTHFLSYNSYLQKSVCIVVVVFLIISS